MPTATECLYLNEQIDVERALLVKESARGEHQAGPMLRCIECGRAVRPHRSGGHAPAHFEHLQRNPGCSLSHRLRNAARRNTLRLDYSLDDQKAIEGYEIDRKIMSVARNAGIVGKCKERDNYTCRACGFRLQIDGHFVIECHHTRPLSANGMREVSLKELVCLCPTCHRIAHTRSEPFSVEQISELRGLQQ